MEKLALGGDALGRVGGPPPKQVVFVPYGAPGDVAELGTLELKKNFARGWIKILKKPSGLRADPPCPYFYKPGAEPLSVCGGCDWQHLDYARQTRAKKDLLIETFQRLGRIPAPAVEDTLAAQDPWRYRNKVQVPFAETDGRLTAGFYAPDSHHVIAFDDCLIQNRQSVDIVHAVLDWFRQNPVEARHPGEGWLRHLLIRTNSKSEAMAAVVTRDEGFSNALGFARFLEGKCPGLVSLYQNVNPKPGNAVLGPEWRHLNGKRALEENLLGLRFRLSPGAFFQVNHAMAEKLFQTVEEFTAPDPAKTVLELYAGVGVIAQILARKSRKVWAVEENAAAVEDGVASAALNGVENIKFMASRCETALARGRFKQGPDDRLGAVVVDPPRAGCDQLVLRGVMRLAPEKIVYVSCDPATLARDARYLATGGYLLKRSRPVDLFPQTAHIESVSLFAK